VFVRWEEVFINIKKYWKWSFLKVNIVITKDNLYELFDLVKFVVERWVKEIAITYPDLDLRYYWKEHLLDKVSPKYSDSILEIIKIDEYCWANSVRLKIVDFPFCVFPKSKLENFIIKTDEFDYWNRLKIGTELFEGWSLEPREVIDRNDLIPRERRLIDKCNWCKYNKLCWWPAVNYKELYWYDEINPIKNDR
jgi:MoaA/NifB/PqqE/SkfB family radical SAM enzyme